MNAFDYAFHHIECVLRMMRGDESALDDMDISADGFWRSFAAIAFSVPALFFSWVIYSRQLVGEGAPGSVIGYVGVQGVLEISLWLLPLVILAFVLPPLGYGKRFSHLVIMRNWAAVIFNYLFAASTVVELIAGSAGAGLASLFVLVLIVFAISISIRLTRMALQCPPPLAIMLVLVEFIAMLFLAITLYEIAGLGG